MDKTDRPVSPEEEVRLWALFETLIPPLEDEGFSAIVTRRIRRRVWLRRVVLGTAVFIGGVLAFGPLFELSVQISGLSVLLAEGLVSLATSWNDPGWLAQNGMVLILALLAVSSPGAIRLLER